MKTIGKIIDGLFVVTSFIIGLVCFFTSFKYFHQDLFLVFLTCAYVNFDNCHKELRK